MSRSFEGTHQIAEENIEDMDSQLIRLVRTHDKYLKHGAVNSAAELMTEIQNLKRDVECEQELFRQTFY